MNLLAPARSASIMQFFLGGALAVFGLVILLAASFAPMSEVADQIRRQGMSVPEVTGWTAAELLRLVYSVLGSGIILTGGILLLLAAFVRGGGMLAVASSMAVNVLISLVLLVFVVDGLIQMPGNPMSGLFSLIIGGGGVGMCGVTIARLVGAIRVTSQIRGLRMMQQMQFQEFQHGQGGPFSLRPPDAP